MRPRILSSYSRGLDLPGIQPRGEMRIDWSHPISNGLSYLRVLNTWGNARALFNDNGDEGEFSISSGTPILGVTATGGIGLSGDGSIRYGNGNASNYVPPQTTGTCVTQVTAGFAANDGLPHCALSVSLASGSFSIYKYSDNQWYGGWVQGTDYRAIASAIGVFNAGESFSIAVTYDTAVNTKMYAKGSLQATNATPPVTTGGANTFVIGDDGSSIDAWNKSEKDGIHYIGFWKRVLSTDEIALLNADPYCFLTSAEGEMPALFTAAATTTTNGVRLRKRWNRSPLAFPAGVVPGFDPFHPASNGISGGEGISVVAINGNFVDLTTGRLAAKTGASNWGFESGIGPGVRVLINESFEFTGKLAVTPTAITMAAIAQFDIVGDVLYHSLIQPDTGGDRALLCLNGASGQLTVYMGLDVTSGFTPVADTPYFLAASVVTVGGNGTYNFAALDLRTGKLFTSTQVSSPIVASNGTYRVGNNTGTNQSTNGPLAAAMYAPTYLTLPQLVQWAQDPWAFWYPGQARMLTTTAAASSATYAAFTTPQHDDGRTITQMVGY